jgi:hypothetical protein
MEKTSWFLVCLFPILISTSLVQAQDVQVRRPAGSDGLKSLSKARRIAVTNTTLAVGTGLGAVALFNNGTIQKTGALLTVYGILAGPSTGNFYANDYPRGFAGLAVRTTGAYLMIDATRELFGNTFADELGVDSKEGSLTDTKMIIGGALVLGSAIYNILSTTRSVREYNQGQPRFAINVGSTMIEEKIAPLLTANIRF